MTKTQIISARILTLTANGMDIREAIDTVLGAGTSATIIDSVYDTLRARK